MIAFGHSWETIQNYSLGQIKIFLKSAEIIKKQELAINLENQRLAHWGDGKQVTKLIEHYKNGN